VIADALQAMRDQVLVDLDSSGVFDICRTLTVADGLKESAMPDSDQIRGATK
jgi:hypothetical protein